MGFTPVFAAYFFVFSFCLTYCDWNLLSTGCRVIVPLASGVCPLEGETILEACADFLLGGTGACPLVGTADGQDHVKDCV